MLREALRQARSIAIVGLEKNTGKTTVLNHLVEVFGGERTLFLTSIGYDGESVDLVTGIDKPRIRVPQGTLVATARGLLPRCTVQKEILETTGLATALGEVILFRALEEGFVELAGPPAIADMKELVDGVRRDYEALPLIDGALSRLSSAGHGLAEEVILCTGASVDPQFSRIMERTLLTARQLQFKKTSHRVDLAHAVACLIGEETVTSLAPSEYTGLLPVTEILAAWSDEPVLALRGLLSDTMARQLLSWKGFMGRTIILEDATRLMVTPATFRRLQARHIGFEVITPVRLLCIALNPVSPQGRYFDESRARTVLSEAGVPVINVRRSYAES